MDLNREYIKKHLLKLKNIPTEYIHNYMLPAWLAPKEIQKEARCVMWKDYPKPVVDMCTYIREAVLFSN